ncbi:MAG: ATP-binding protein [Chloroflexi bacterium]|nr:ATP-binding protein [Chloroflexota bacterium]MBU1662773.1 ATP-binding protein [Chloroflexota bacterium]
MLPRPVISQQIETALTRSRIVVLIGPRQCGKTTLARTFVSPDSLNYFDLEDPVSLARLAQPMTALRDLHGLVIIDEVQRRPDLFPILRVLVDRDPLPARFLILSSASPDLLRQSSETLAGRLEIIPMNGFSLAEVGVETINQHWLRGGFPLSFLAQSESDSMAWRKNFTQTFLERDLPQLGVQIPANTLLRFWTMLAHYHGQIWNASELARSLGISQPAVQRYVDTLEGVFMVRQIRPWHANLKKRQVKSPKVYLRDTGLLHYLLGIGSERDLWMHPKSGASWEGYVVEETIKAIQPDEIYFWATHGGAELDMLLIKDGKRIGVECKRVDAPSLTRSMRIALDDLALDRLIVIYPGVQHYPLTERVTAIPVKALAGDDVFLAVG